MALLRVFAGRFVVGIGGSGPLGEVDGDASVGHALVGPSPHS